MSSKNSKKIWKVIHRILKPNKSTIKADMTELNKYFNKTEKRVMSSQSRTKQELKCFINLFSNKDDAFQLQPLSCKSIENASKLHQTTVLQDVITFQHLL